MATRKISELSAASTLAGTEVVAVVQNGSTRRATVAAIGNTGSTFPSISMSGVSTLAAVTATTVATTGTISAGGVLTPTGGVAAAGGFTTSARGLHTGNQTVTQTTDGNDTTPSVTETYICEVYVPYNCAITGIALFNGSVAAGNITVQLANSAGVPVATKSASTAMVGTDTFQLIPLGASYDAVGPATYLVLVQFDNTSARFNSHILGAFGASKKTGEVYGTFTNVTPPTTFTTAVGPIASLY